MRLHILYTGARSAAIRLEGLGLYDAEKPCRLTLNGQDAGEAKTCVYSLFHLTPLTRYLLEARVAGQAPESVSFMTQAESVTLDVRAFGAAGDGAHDDTAAIQAAILCCPEKGRVLIKKGDYLVSPLFLKSHIHLEIKKGARLLLTTERARCPILPGMIERRDGGELNLGTWEGNPLDMYAALITGVGVEDVAIYGEGVLDGQADRADWWQSPKTRRGAWRGRMVFLNACKDVTLQGLTIQNSPAWNVHPYFSTRLKFLNLTVKAPKDSPNTDGFDPESCTDVLLAGARFSLGDDCVAIKSGKLYMGKTYHAPCRGIEIMHCLMEDGHGGVTIGSETSGGVYDVNVHHCLMRHTDRCLRVKTRRGRGEASVIDSIRFSDIRAEGVKVPFVVNAFYFCDPDGHSEYVQRRDALKADARTPRLGTFSFHNIDCFDAEAAAGVFLGLPEMPIERIELKDVRVRFSNAPAPFAAVMADHFLPVAGRGLIVQNARTLALKNVEICAEPRVETTGVERVEEEAP